MQLMCGGTRPTSGGCRQPHCYFALKSMDVVVAATDINERPPGGEAPLRRLLANAYRVIGRGPAYQPDQTNKAERAPMAALANL